MSRLLALWLVVLLVAAWRPAHAADYGAETALIASLAHDAKYDEALSRSAALVQQIAVAEGARSLAYARAIGWQAYLLQAQGRFLEAEPHFQKSLEILEQVLPTGHPDVATAINNLGFQYQATDRLVEAEALYKRALAMREKAVPRSNLLVADSFNNLAQVLKAQGRLAEATPLLRRALDLRAKELPPVHPLIAQSLANLAGMLERIGQSAEAEPLLRRALAIRQASQTTDHPEIAGITSKLAQNLSRQGRFAEAHEHFERALGIRARTQPSDHIDVAGTLHDTALNLLALRRLSEARRALERSLAIRRAVLPASHPEIARSLTDLARILLAAGDRADAAGAIDQSLKLLLARERFDDAARAQIADATDVAWEAWRDDTSAAPVELVNQVFQLGQRAMATPTATAVSRMAARFATRDASLRSMIRERETAELRLSALEQEFNGALATSEPVNLGRIRQDIEMGERNLKRIDVGLQRDFPGYFSLVRPQPISVADVGRVVGDDEALVAIVPTATAIYTLAVTRETAVWRVATLKPYDIDRLVAELRETLDIEKITDAGAKARLFDLGTAHKLYSALLGPVEPVIGRKSHLIISAAGTLTGLPFQVLLTAPPKITRPMMTELASYRDAPWLMRRHAISVLPAVGSLVALRNVAGPVAADRALIGFGNPAFAATAPGPAVRSARTSRTVAARRTTPRLRGYANFWRGPAADLDKLRQELPALPETEVELKSIASHLAPAISQLVLGAAATETSVKNAALDRFRIVYFATHGLVAGEVKGLGEPALALTIPAHPSELDDGLLTASEVALLRLDADWVVLSACNTAAGERPGADALSGLARSFFHAGARAMLVSHWRVDSDATAAMMTSIFGAMSHDAKLGRAEAMRKAMLAAAANVNDPWSGYPAFWAPFSLIGEGR